MSVKIFSVGAGSLAAKKKLEAGDELLSLNGHEITDVLDYRFYLDSDRLKIVFRKPSGRLHAAKIKKLPSDDIGLEFETYLMDKQRSCKNKCVFCFIDQLPRGLRSSLYFKDDDSRLSFLFGNYITLTNTDEREIDRIIQMHISPVNVSVHTMNPELRVKMMRNPHAGEALGYLRKLAAAGVKLNTQLVLCPGINDGKELEFSLKELGALYPAVSSIAAVPVGLTGYRSGLASLEPFTQETARAVIDAINSFNAHFEFDHGEKIAYAADEFYIKAGLPMPGAEYYGDFPQLENGVGSWALLKSEFEQALEGCGISAVEKRMVTAVTGEAAYPLIRALADELESKVKGVKVNVIAAKNMLFGGGVTVAGLLGGEDILNAVKGVEIGDELLIPAVSLRHEGDMFLDDKTLINLRSEFSVNVNPVANNGRELFEAMLGRL